VPLEVGAKRKEKCEGIHAAQERKRIRETNQIYLRGVVLHIPPSVQALVPQLAMSSCVGGASELEVVRARSADDLLSRTAVAAQIACLCPG
jgi:hypothetical protein